MSAISSPTRAALLLALLLLNGCGLSSASHPRVASTALLSPPTGAAPPAITAALVTDTGGLYDGSYNQHAWTGLVDAQRVYGVQPTVLQSKRSADYLPSLERLARRHLGLIVAVGYSMSGAVYQAAKAYPAQRFVLIDAVPTDKTGRPRVLKNVAAVFFKEQESGYLVGVIAGLMEKDRVGKAVHNTIGYLGATHIPGVDDYIAGYVAGARRVDPRVKILGDYAGTFFNRNLGEATGLRQIRRGADILFQVAGTTGLGYLDAVRQQGVYGIGVDINQSYLGPFVITSAIKKVTLVVKDMARYAQDGTFRGGVFRFGLQTYGATGFSKPTSAVPAGIVAAARRFQREVASGTIVPPTRVPGA